MGIGTEVGKAVGQTVVDTAADGRGIIKVLFGPAAKELGETLGDQARFFRFRNLSRILEKAQAIADRRGLNEENLKVLPFGDAIRVVEASSYEEDEGVQDLWARLIANAASPDRDTSVKKAYLDVLKSLSGVEAALLDLLWEGERTPLFQTKEEVAAFNARMNAYAELRFRTYSEDDRDVAVQNLTRLRCITFRPRQLDADRLLGQLPMPREWRSSMIGSGNWAAVDPRKFEKLLNEIVAMISAVAGLSDYKKQDKIPLQAASGFLPSLFWGSFIEVPEMNYVLTPLGRDLLKACQVEGESPVPPESMGPS